eukprot:8312947-Pyramimonas_sp.AAC.1
MFARARVDGLACEHIIAAHTDGIAILRGNERGAEAKATSRPCGLDVRAHAVPASHVATSAPK